MKVNKFIPRTPVGWLVLGIAAVYLLGKLDVWHAERSAAAGFAAPRDGGTPGNLY